MNVSHNLKSSCYWDTTDYDVRNYIINYHKIVPTTERKIVIWMLWVKTFSINIWDSWF